MKKWLIIAPLTAAAAGAAAFALTRGKKAAPGGASKPAKSAKAAPVIKNAKTAVYNFASGYKDSKTVEVSLGYDADKFSFAVVSEDFLAQTGDSHVGVLYGEDFGVQIEYAAYYHGEDFAALSKQVSERYKGFAQVSFNGVEGIRYFDGGDLRMAFPAVGASADYVLVSVVITGDDDGEGYLALPDNADLNAVMGTLTITTA